MSELTSIIAFRTAKRPKLERLAAQEKRTLSNMVDVLLDRALDQDERFREAAMVASAGRIARSV